MDTGTSTPHARADDTPRERDAMAALLQLLWLSSPALPVGGFSYSEGLESGVDEGLVRNEAEAGDWIEQQLLLSLARSDLAVVASAVDAARRVDAARLAVLDDWVLQTRETAEFRLQCAQMGYSMTQWMRAIQPGNPALAPGRGSTYPVAYAIAATGSDAGRETGCDAICTAYAFAWVENMVQAAVKAVPLGQSAGQRVLARLVAAIPGAVRTALSLDDAGRQAFSPMLAILSSRHEAQYSRLFRS